MRPDGPPGQGGDADDCWRVECLGAFMRRVGINKQERLAARSGVLQQTISCVKTGRNYLSTGAAEKLAPALGVEASDLRLACVLWLFDSRLRDGEITPQDRQTFREVVPLARTLEQRDAVWETFQRLQAHVQNEMFEDMRHLFFFSHHQ